MFTLDVLILCSIYYYLYFCTYYQVAMVTYYNFAVCLNLFEITRNYFNIYYGGM